MAPPRERRRRRRERVVVRRRGGRPGRRRRPVRAARRDRGAPLRVARGAPPPRPRAAVVRRVVRRVVGRPSAPRLPAPPAPRAPRDARSPPPRARQGEARVRGPRASRRRPRRRRRREQRRRVPERARPPRAEHLVLHLRRRRRGRGRGRGGERDDDGGAVGARAGELCFSSAPAASGRSSSASQGVGASVARRLRGARGGSRRRPRRARIEPGDLYGWLNANEAGDFNKLHEHGGADSWSGVFYLHCHEPRRRRTGGRGEDVRGESESDGSDGSESESESESESTGVGCLGLRCHAPPEEEGGTDRRAAAVPFLRHRPRAGELVLFRGDVLHAVESVGRAPRGRATREARDIDMEDVRLSVAFNEDSRANDAKEREERSERGEGSVSPVYA